MMEKVCKMLVIILCLTVCISTSPEVLAETDVFPNELGLTQNTSVTCTLASAAMMVRGRLYRSYNSSWPSVTEENIKPIAWTDQGLRWSWTYSNNGNTLSIAHEFCSGMTVSRLKDLLIAHPEGIVLYETSVPHAVFVCDYQGDTFYCFDPANSSYSGRRPLSNSFLGARLGTQSNILNSVDAYWYVSSYSITPSVSPEMTNGAGRTIPDGNYIIVSAADPNYFLDIEGNEYPAGDSTNVSLYGRHNRTVPIEDTWTVTYIDEGGFYTIHQNGTNMSLDVDSASTSAGANVKVWTYHDSPAQKWSISQNSDGSYRIQAKCSSLSLDIHNAVLANGTNIIQYDSHDGVAQQWNFVPYPEFTPCTVTYNANGGTGEPESQSTVYGNNLVVLSEIEPTRADSSAGSYAVTLNASGGSVSPTSMNAACTTSYTFKNWNTAADGSGTSYAAGATYSADADVTLYAQWNSSTSTAAVTLPTPTREGYTFKGWSANESAADGITGSYTPDENVTMYALWTQESPSTSTSISIDSVNTNPGAEISIPVRLVNNPGLISAEFEITYNSDLLEWIGVEPGEYSTVGDYEADIGQPITWFASDERTDVTLNGIFATLTFRVNENADDTETVITANYDADNVFNAEFDNVAIAVIPGKVIIKSHIPGDVNGDGKVNNKDYMALRRYIKYKDNTVIEAALDINGDGKVNNKDYMALRRYIKYKDIVIK